MLTYVEKTLEKFFMQLNRYTGYTGTNSKNITNNQPKSKIDKTKIQDMLFFEYSITLLETMKKTYELIYLKEREQEKLLIPHTEKHLEKIELMNKIREDIVKIQAELNILRIIKGNTHQDIMQDLNVKYIIKT